jgi:hypothetical protein
MITKDNAKRPVPFKSTAIEEAVTLDIAGQPDAVVAPRNFPYFDSGNPSIASASAQRAFKADR